MKKLKVGKKCRFDREAIIERSLLCVAVDEWSGCLNIALRSNQVTGASVRSCLA